MLVLDLESVVTEKQNYTVHQTSQMPTGRPATGVRKEPENERFDLRLYLPKGNASFERVMILVCGFNEDTPFTYDNFFGPVLAEMGIPSLLLPLSFHLWRRPENSPDPASLVHDNPPRFYAGFLQILSDVWTLAEGLRTSNGGTVQKQLADDCRVGVLGYSLGGMAALSSFLLKPRLFSGCFLFNSGASLYALNPPAAILPEDQFRAAREKIADFVEATESWRTAASDVLNGDAVPGPETEVFRGLFLDDESGIKRVQGLISPRLSDILCFGGAEDEVCPPLAVAKFSPPGKRLKILKLEGVKHFMLEGRYAWRRSRETVAREISAVLT